MRILIEEYQYKFEGKQVNGYKSHTSVFRVLNRHGGQLNRVRGQGVVKKSIKK